MLNKVLRAWCWVLCAGAVPLLGAGTLHAAKEHVAERFDVTAAVRPDGSLGVTETLAFRFTGGDYTHVNRSIPSRNTDGIEVLAVSMDGRELPWGDDPGQAEVDYGNSRANVIWHFAPTRDRTHVFTLHYRLTGVVRHGDGEDWFEWLPYPTDFDYPIEAGTARLTWMEGIVLRRQPDVRGAVVAMSPEAHGLEAAVANYTDDDDAVLMAVRFETGAFPGAEPQWQRDERRGAQMAPAFIAAGCMIAAATILALILFSLKHRREPGAMPSAQTVQSPPDDLSPALAGSIVHGRVAAGGPQMQAVLFDLARRGVISIDEQQGTGLFKSRQFVVRRGRDTALLPHEQVVRDRLFAKHGNTPRLDKALRSVIAGAREFGKAVKAELKAAGFIDADRIDATRAMLIAGAVVMVFAGSIAFVLAATHLRLGAASLAIPIALFLSGLTMVLVGATYSTLSTRGHVAATRWKAYRRYLKEQARSRQLPANADQMSMLLPFAAAFGLGPWWQRAMKHMPDTAVPVWLGTLSPSGRQAVFVAMMASSSSSTGHGHGGAGGGGGAAGGGSSSAG
jgi:uncharacterized membrane protein YgcG